MKFNIAQLIIQGAVIGTFALNSFNYQYNIVGEDESSQIIKVPISGFEAITSGHFFTLGSVVVAVLLLSAIYHLVAQTIILLNKNTAIKLAPSIIVITNIQMVAGLLTVTLLGTFLEVFGFVMIGLIVLGAIIKYRFQA